MYLFSSRYRYTATHYLEINTPYIHCTAFDGSEGNINDMLNLWINGESQFHQAGNPTASTTTGGVDRVYIGWTSSGFVGDIAEVIYFDNKLSETQRTGIEKYLSEKWGISIP